MSEVDTRLPIDQRERLVREVRDHLPAFLSKASIERSDPLGDVRDLLGLAPADLDRMVAVHVVLSGPVRALVTGLQDGLRNPITATVRRRSSTRAVHGSIDWGATFRHRSSGADRSEFIVRPARRVFDTAENRALAYALEQIELQLQHVPTALAGSAITDPSWSGEIGRMRSQVAEARRHHWLRDVPAQRPDPLALRRLRAARRSFYRNLIPDALSALFRWTESPSPDDIAELLMQRWFEPRRDWQLFELVVALRVSRAFGQASLRRRTARLLVSSAHGRSPFARYELSDGSEVRLWYQSWPGRAEASTHRDACRRFGIAGGASRPDIVVQRCGPDGSTLDAVVVEVKATTSSTYLGSGLMQLLGYLNDRRSLFAAQPAGWLVAPASSAFSPAPAEDSELWVVSDDAVATALTDRFAASA